MTTLPTLPVPEIALSMIFFYWKVVVVFQERYRHRGSWEPASVSIIDLTLFDRRSLYTSLKKTADHFWPVFLIITINWKITEDHYIILTHSCRKNTADHSILAMQEHCRSLQTIADHCILAPRSHYYSSILFTCYFKVARTTAIKLK